MTKGTGTTVIADSVVCVLADGANGTIEFDIASECGPYLGHGAHTTGKFTSQQYKENTITKDGSLEPTTLTVTLVPSEYEQIETWWKSGTSLTYTVTGETAGLMDRTYTQCFVRVTDQPSVVPGAEGKVTIGIEISTIMNAADLNETV